MQCASRHVTETEARYSATEIELLAVVWAVHKARLFLAGADFQLLVDHKPLIPILNAKTLDELTSPRIVRLREKLTPFRFVAQWRPGADHKVADCLSRHPVSAPDPDDKAGEEEIEHCYCVLRQLSQEDEETGHTVLPDLGIYEGAGGGHDGPGIPQAAERRKERLSGGQGCSGPRSAPVLAGSA